MAKYEYKCTNEDCVDFDVVKSVDIPMSEYSEDKLPVCEKCSEKTTRVFSNFVLKTAGDGIKF